MKIDSPPWLRRGQGVVEVLEWPPPPPPPPPQRLFNEEGSHSQSSFIPRPENFCVLARYFVTFSNSSAAELMSAASAVSTLATAATPSSAILHFFCSIASRIAGMVLTPYPV